MARSRAVRSGARVAVVSHLDCFTRDLAATLDAVRRFARRGVESHVVGRGRVEADKADGAGAGLLRSGERSQGRSQRACRGAGPWSGASAYTVSRQPRGATLPVARRRILIPEKSTDGG